MTFHVLHTVMQPGFSCVGLYDCRLGLCAVSTFVLSQWLFNSFRVVYNCYVGSTCTRCAANAF